MRDRIFIAVFVLAVVGTVCTVFAGLLMGWQDTRLKNQVIDLVTLPPSVAPTTGEPTNRWCLEIPDGIRVKEVK